MPHDFYNCEMLMNIENWVNDRSVAGDKKEAYEQYLYSKIMKICNFAYLSLDSLPIHSLTHLTVLTLTGNKFKSLPTEIGMLTNLHTLFLLHNQVTLLPTEIGMLTNLLGLHLQSNLLTSLPSELGNLTHLSRFNIHHNPDLAELPMSLGQIPGLYDLDIEGTKIEHEVSQSILNQCRVMRDGNAAAVLPARLAKWKAIGKCSFDLQATHLSVEQKKTLNEWLNRLEITKDYSQKQSSLAAVVCNIVADLLQHQEFQELFFPQAEANNACCGDRAAMSLNETYTSWIILCQAAKLPLVEKLKMMTAVAKTLCLRKELQKLINKHERESAEIFLYYESTLKERLNLATAIQDMTYQIIGKRDWINIDTLAQHVAANFFEELFGLPLFEKLLMEDPSMQQRWEVIDAKFAGNLEILGACPPGDPNDEKVLNYQFRQGEIVLEWKRCKAAIGKEWYQVIIR